VIRSGADVTIVALSQMVLEAAKAAEILAADGISAEIVDPRWVAPLDDEMILSSVRRTGRLVVADTGWTSFGVSAEVAARVAERLFGVLKGPVQRVALPDVPTPCSAALEGLYYPGAAEIVAAVRRAVGATGAEPRELVGRGPRGMATKDTFQGPF
jgi:acetoin:2,6-dichlorophenolindophenol oxidoreductase subunit beta